MLSLWSISISDNDVLLLFGTQTLPTTANNNTLTHTHTHTHTHTQKEKTNKSNGNLFSFFIFCLVVKVERKDVTSVCLMEDC